MRGKIVGRLALLAIVGVLGSQAHKVGLGVASFNTSLGVGNVQGFVAHPDYQRLELRDAWLA